MANPLELLKIAKKAAEPITETQAVKIMEADLKEAAKKCPSCREPPIVTEDKWKCWRCFCPGCNRWEAMAYPSEARAIHGWNSSFNTP